MTVKDCYTITVYRGIIENHNEDDNLMDIVVKKEDFENWFSSIDDNPYSSINDFFDNYTADDTISLVSHLYGIGEDILVISMFKED